jgi:flagellar protein FlbD
MIALKRLGSTAVPFVLNADLIKTVESVPDTVVTLLSGEKLLVLESVDEIVERVKDYRRSCSATPSGTGATGGKHG